MPPPILSFSDQFTKAYTELAQSNIEQELKQEIASIKEDIAAGFDDPNNWLKVLTYFKDHPDEIRHHLSAAVSNTVEWNDSFLVEFFENIRLQLTEDILQKANTVIIRYSEVEFVHLDFHYIDPAEPIVQQSGYDESIPGTEVSLYEIGKTSCRSAKIYDHPIDTSEVFMSIANEYFETLIGLRQNRILQSILVQTVKFLRNNFPMEGYKFYVGDYHDPLFIE